MPVEPTARDVHYPHRDLTGLTVIPVGLACSCHLHRRYINDPLRWVRREAAHRRLNGI